MKLTLREVEYLEEKHQAWTCPACLSNTRLTRSNSAGSCSPLPSQKGTPKSDNDRIFDMLSNIAAEIREIKDSQLTSSRQISDCLAKLELHSEAISANKLLITGCQSRIGEVEKSHADLDTKVELLTDKLSLIETSNKTASVSDTAEIIERVSRSSNVVMYNLPEATASSQQADRDRVVEIIKSIDNQAADKITFIHRLGQVGNHESGSAKPRALRITFVDPGTARVILRKRRYSRRPHLRKYLSLMTKHPPRLESCRSFETSSKGGLATVKTT